ncbi:DUF4265 domain-containing protein [Streptomyces sp. NPDC048241]|uniref:DUF4265 domain-containing protein n=1 Tax=Streptomyces sp. NPDC048241 TaxID=3365521 RepID=UPI003717CCAC
MEDVLQVTIDGVTYVSHEDPAWRGESNFMAMVDLTPFDLPGMREQLWLREVDEGGAYEVSCIPFYAYGVALGDVVGTSDAHDVVRVIRKSGRRAIRVLFTEPRPSVDSRSALRAAVESANLLSEWNGDRMVAIDFPDGSSSQPIVDCIQGEVEGGTAFWEWSDSMEFSPA